MIRLEAERLNSLPISGMSRVRDLIYFDGPLLSQYVNAHGEHFLYYWCDRDETTHRWMLLRVEERTVLRLLHRFIPLNFVIPAGGQDDFVYFIDVTSGGGISGVWLTGIPNVPDTYQPAPGTFLQDIPRSAHTGYPVLIEGDWNASELMGFPRQFEVAYSFLYVVNKLVHDKCFGGYNWRGGYPSMHFNRLIANIPTESRFGVQAFQYKSPGFVRFSVDYDIAEMVAMSVEDIRTEHVKESARELKRYISRNGLRDIKDPDDPVWAEHTEKLLHLTRELARGLRAVDAESVITGSERAFEAAQVIRWFCRRIGDIERYERMGLIKLAPVEQQSAAQVSSQSRTPRATA